MKPITTIVLAVLLVVCIVVALFTSDLFTPSKPKDGDEVKRQDVFDPAPGKPVKLVIDGRNGHFAFEKADDKWRIAEPVQAKAEDWRVNDVADALKDLKGRPAEGVGDETTGLDKPVWTVTLTDDKQKVHKLLVGRPRPMKSSETYVRPAGGKTTYIADVDFASKLDKPLSDYRDETVLDLKTDDVARVTIAGKESFELVRKDDQWALTRPVSSPADAEEVKKVLDAVARVTASEFVDDAPKDLAPYGLDRPQLIAEVQMKPEEPKEDKSSTQPATKPAVPPKPGKKQGLALGKQVGDKLYARLTGAPGVFKVPDSKLKDLQPKLVTLRDKKVLRVSADDVTAVEIEMPAGKAALARKLDAWEMTSPLKGPADKDAVQKLLDGVAGLKAENFEDAPSAAQVRGLETAKVKITLSLAGKGEKATLLIGDQSGSGEMTFVKSASGLSVAVVKTSDLKDLLAEPATYWDRTVLKLPPDAKVSRLELRRPDATFTLARKDAGGEWQLSAPLAADGDKDQVNKIIDRLEDLKADRIVYLGSQVPDSYAKAQSIMQVLVTTQQTPPAAASQPATQPASQPASQPATQPATQASQPAGPKPEPAETVHQVTVAKVGLHSYAWAKGAKVLAVGQFAPSLYDDLAGELRSREIWKIDPDKITGISLLAGEDKLLLARDGENWTYTPDRYVKIDATKVADFLKDVKELKAEKFAVQKTPADLKEYGLDKPWLTLELTDEKGKRTALTVSHAGATKTEDRYAVSPGVEGVFKLPASAVEKLGKKLADLKK